VALLIAIAAINVWNRLDVATRQVAAADKPPRRRHDMTIKAQGLDDPTTGRRKTLAHTKVVPICRRLVLVALAGLLALGACSTSDAATDAPAAGNGGPTVTVQDMAYTPETLTVQAGTTVTWVWNDGAIAHDVRGDGFRSKVVSEGTFGHRFDQPGTYDYVCTLHPNMTGTIEVTG
jgi:plastocyanin